MINQRQKLDGPPANGSGPGSPIRDQCGVGLVITMLILLIIGAIGSTMMITNVADLEISNNFSNRSVAFYAADSGLEATGLDLRQDSAWIAALVSPATWTAIDPVPSGVTINGSALTLVSGSTYTLGTTAALGEGTYQRTVVLPPVVNVVDGDGTITFETRSTGGGGAVDPSTQVVRADVEIGVEGYGVWDNAVFAGEGAAGALINGNVAIRGSVHIVGDPSNPPNITLSGTADIRNNYSDAAAEFGSDASKLPSLGTVDFNGEAVESLNAVVRLQNGTITLGGASDIGEADVTGNSIKETIDAVKTGGTVGPSNKVFTDEWGPYDADGLTLPSLADPYTDPATGTTYASHSGYLDAVSLEINKHEISRNVNSFSHTDGVNSISWNKGTQHLTIDGVVKIDGDLQIGKTTGSSSQRAISYDGTGTLYVTDDVEIVGSVVPSGNYIADGNLGIIAGDVVEIERTSHMNIFAAIYAENEISVSKQSAVAGALVSNYFDLGSNVPAVFQVPSLATNLPPGMPGGARIATVAGVRIANWYQER
jgi:hypothetical protein